jgi:hypothetical protein
VDFYNAAGLGAGNLVRTKINMKLQPGKTYHITYSIMNLSFKVTEE